MALMDGKPTDFDTIYFQSSAKANKALAKGSSVLRLYCVGTSSCTIRYVREVNEGLPGTLFQTSQQTGVLRIGM
ncbi:MAG: hypothetical protein L6R35_002546 [Caloplaca aegaea]|nr:MAG: hypothetical protein L6R35_002546 [Caloplaca aegaea]